MQEETNKMDLQGLLEFLKINSKVEVFVSDLFTLQKSNEVKFNMCFRGTTDYCLQFTLDMPKSANGNH